MRNVFHTHLVPGKLFAQAQDTWSSSSTQEQEVLISQKKMMGDRWCCGAQRELKGGKIRL